MLSQNINHTDLTIGIINHNDIFLCHRLLQKLYALDINPQCIRIFDNEPKDLRCGESKISTTSIQIDNMLQCNLIINLQSQAFIKQYSADILAQDIKIIDLSACFMDEIPLSCRLDAANIAKSNLISCPNGFIISMYKIIHYIRDILSINDDCISIAAYKGYHAKDVNTLLDETKMTFFEPKLENFCFNQQIAFNAFINTQESELKQLKSLINGNILYHSINIPILNIDGACITINSANIRKAIKSEIFNMASHYDKELCISYKGSMMEASHENRIYIHEDIQCSQDGKAFSMFIYFDTFEIQISELIRLIQIIA